MAIDTLGANALASNSVTSAKIADGAVVTADIADDAITTAKISNDAIGADQLADNSVVTANITSGAISTAKVADGAVTSVKTTGVGKPQNLIVNGAMQVSQRTVSETSVNSDRYSACDRFKIFNNQAHFTVSQETLTASQDLPVAHGFTKALKLDCTTAQASPGVSDRMKIRHSFEGQQMQHLKYGGSSAETLSLQFWVKATKTGVNTINMYQDDASKMISASYTISASNTWEKKTVSFAGNTSDMITNDNTRGLLVEWNLGGGSNRTSGTLRTAWTAYTDADEMPGQVNHADNTANNFHITGIQLEVGSTAGAFEFREYTDVYRHCQRYLYRIKGSIYEFFVNGVRNNTNYLWAPLQLPVPLRTQPTITTAGTSNNCFGIWHGAGGSWSTTHTTMGLYSNPDMLDGSVQQLGLALNGISTGFGAGYCLTLAFSGTDKFMNCDAEL